jgi:hypothetical protein
MLLARVYQIAPRELGRDAPALASPIGAQIRRLPIEMKRYVESLQPDCVER